MHDSLQDITPVILCGGAGRRLWPLSRRSRPKPFLHIRGRRTMLQQTAMRVKNAQPPVLVLSRTLIDQARHDLAEIGVIAPKIIAEPAMRNTAAALAAAALECHSGLILVLPSDHRIDEPDKLLKAIHQATPLARDGWVVSFGIRATRPDIAFGYIRRGSVFSKDAYRIDRFIEKPSRDIARMLLRSGTCDWNSGIFLLSSETALSELRRFEPDLLSTVEKSMLSAVRNDEVVYLGPEFSHAPALSFDIALMERTDKALVMPIDMGWDDLGTWSGLLRYALS